MNQDTEESKIKGGREDEGGECRANQEKKG